jgi:3-(3-hydroxy-phenyl)propionate hydroxylase
LVVERTVNDDVLERLPQTQVQYCEPARSSSFVIGPGNHRRWELMLLPGDSLSEDFPEDELWPLLARWIKPGDGTLRRAAAYRFHGLVAQRWRDGRILLAGDSAHMTPPFMAQGMVQGVRDAQNLAWKLRLVIAGDAPPALLDT